MCARKRAEKTKADFRFGYSDQNRDWGRVLRYIQRLPEVDFEPTTNQAIWIALSFVLTCFCLFWASNGFLRTQEYYCNTVILPKIITWQLERHKKVRSSPKNKVALVPFRPIPFVPLFCVHTEEMKKGPATYSHWNNAEEEWKHDPISMSCVRFAAYFLPIIALIVSVIVTGIKTMPDLWCSEQIILQKKLEWLQNDKAVILKVIEAEERKIQNQLASM